MVFIKKKEKKQCLSISDHTACTMYRNSRIVFIADSIIDCWTKVIQRPWKPFDRGKVKENMDFSRQFWSIDILALIDENSGILGTLKQDTWKKPLKLCQHFLSGHYNPSLSFSPFWSWKKPFERV